MKEFQISKDRLIELKKYENKTLFRADINGNWFFKYGNLNLNIYF